MKTAISIPDSQFEAAEKLAARLGLSRSELYQQALSEFIVKYSDEMITEQLNQVYAEEKAVVDEELLWLQAKPISEEDWS